MIRCQTSINFEVGKANKFTTFLLVHNQSQSVDVNKSDNNRI